MIRHNVAQRSDAWNQLRAGIPTASNFHKIITPGGKTSDQAEKYLYFLLAEWALGRAISDGYQSEYMDRGARMEEEAVAAFEFDRGIDTEVVGLVTTDDGLAGCSPDRLAGSDEIVEIKCPAPATHMRYMLAQTPDKDYKPQLQGCLWICERKVINISSYCPGLPSVIIPVERDDAFIAALAGAVRPFVSSMLEKRKELTERYGPFVHPEPKPRHGLIDALSIESPDCIRIAASHRYL